MRLEPVGHRLLDRSPTLTKVSVVYNNRLFRQMLVERRVVVVNQHSDAFVKVGVGQFFVHLDKLLLVVLSYPYIKLYSGNVFVITLVEANCASSKTNTFLIANRHICHNIE